VPPQDVITRDNVTLKVNAVIFNLRVVDPTKAVIEVCELHLQTFRSLPRDLRSGWEGLI